MNMKLANTLALLSTTASSLMLTAYANDELATPALRAAAGSTHSSAASSSISSSFLEQAEDVKAKLVVKKKKAKKIEDEGIADPYANSNFELICVDVTEEDSANWMFCEVLCSMCENEGECCISKHLGCHLNPNLSHLYEEFLAGCTRWYGMGMCVPDPENNKL